jgi:type IX secretion system PorP/SprF family membrane protein
MKKILYILGFLFCTVAQSTAQQIHTVSQYNLHRFLHNPAGAALNGASSVGLTFRSQWSGISGAPKTQMAYGEKYFAAKRLGMAAVLYNDVTGPTKRTGLQYAINYKLPLDASGKNTLSFGIEAKGLQYSIDKNELSASIPGDPVLAEKTNLTKGDAGVGVYYSSPKLNLGASIGQILNSGLRFADNVANTSLRASLYRHYYFMGDYTYTDGTNKVIPSFQIVYLPQSPIEATFGARLEHNENFWWGAHLRVKQGWMLQAGYIHNKKIRFGYAYDFYKTPLSIFNSGGFGAHELMLQYQFNKK